MPPTGNGAVIWPGVALLVNDGEDPGVAGGRE